MNLNAIMANTLPLRLEIDSLAILGLHTIITRLSLRSVTPSAFWGCGGVIPTVYFLPSILITACEASQFQIVELRLCSVLP